MSISPAVGANSTATNPLAGFKGHFEAPEKEEKGRKEREQRTGENTVASQPTNWAGQSPGAPKVLGAPSNFADLKTQNHKYNNDMHESSIS